MPKRSSTDRDFAVNALRVVEQAIGEHIDGTSLKAKAAKGNRAIGGRIGGAARAKSLTADQRRSIAVKAAQARWENRTDEFLVFHTPYFIDSLWRTPKGFEITPNICRKRRSADHTTNAQSSPNRLIRY